MRPNYNIVKQLVLKHIEVYDVCRIACRAGIQVEVLDNLCLLDLALDLIGYPPEEVFNREFVKNEEWEFDERQIDKITQNLFKEYDNLILKRPELFVK
jgi:hypothetical protein